MKVSAPIALRSLFSGNQYRRLGAEQQSLMLVRNPSGLNTRKMKTITEAGLYKLVMRSDKAKAKEFQDWVTGIVLPAIRKDGAYFMGEEKMAASVNPHYRECLASGCFSTLYTGIDLTHTGAAHGAH